MYAMAIGSPITTHAKVEVSAVKAANLDSDPDAESSWRMEVIHVQQQQYQSASS